MNTWNVKDADSHAEAYIFPSYRIAGHAPTCTVISEEVFRRTMATSFKHLQENDDWHHSAWDRRTAIWSEPDKVHFDCCFTRYREDGSIIGVYESIYIVARDSSGKWGVILRSSSAG